MTEHAHQMTRRGMLGLTAGASLAFLAACTSDEKKVKTGPSDLNKLPGDQRLREEAKHLEPTSYVKTYKVDPSGKDGAFTTLKECYAAIAEDKKKRLDTGAASPQSNPWDWRKVEIAPGTYHETLSGTPPHVALIGMGTTPKDTHFITTGDEDTIGTTGRSTYVRNVFLEQNDPNPDSHPLREQGQSGDAGLGPMQRRTVVFEDVVFLAGGGGAWGKTAADIMPGPGTTLVFKGCTFDAPGQQQQVNVVTSSHPTPSPSQYFFIGCTIAGNQKRSGNSDSTVSYPVGAPDFSSGHKDTFVWMDGHWNMGSAVRIDALLAFPSTLDPTNNLVKTKNPSTTYIVINPGQVSGAKATIADGVKAPISQVPTSVHLPQGCLSTQEAVFFGERPSRKEKNLEPKAPAAGTVQVKAGEIYWVAIDLDGKAACTKGVRLASGSDALGGAMITLDKDGKPTNDGNASVGGGAPEDGTVRLESHWYYPGQAPIWVGMSFTKDATVPAMKAENGHAFRGQGSGTPAWDSAKTPITAGTLVPRPVIVSAWPQG